MGSWPSVTGGSAMPGSYRLKQYATFEQARRRDARKIAEKQRKGYAPATAGVRQKRAITRRQITSQPSTANSSPVLWKFATGPEAAFGIFVDAEHCWVRQRGRRHLPLDHEGQVQRQLRMPDGISASWPTTIGSTPLLTTQGLPI